MANIKKYRCLNFGNCEKAGKKEVFEIPEGGEMKCPECGSEMIQEVKSSGKGMIAIVVIAVIAVAGLIFAFFGPEKEAAPEPTPKPGGDPVEVVDDSDETSVDSAEVARQKALADSVAKAREDSIAKAKAKAEADSIAKAKDGEKVGKPANYLTNARCEYGLYTGPAVNGKPGGGLGTIKVRGNHTINLRNARKETIAITNGDIIEKAKFSDGRLVSGVVMFANGQARQFNIGI